MFGENIEDGGGGGVVEGMVVVVDGECVTVDGDVDVRISVALSV